MLLQSRTSSNKRKERHMPMKVYIWMGIFNIGTWRLKAGRVKSEFRPLLGNGSPNILVSLELAHVYTTTRNSPLLDNASLDTFPWQRVCQKACKPELSIARQRFGKQIPVATNTQNTTVELFKVVFSIRFTRSYKRTCNWFVSQSTRRRRDSFVLDSSFEDSFVRELSVQLWCVNQWTTETEDVTDS
jgi:hypothetical protein